jgi:hypothetical protein
MAKGEEHRYFDKEFKYEAIRLVNKGNYNSLGCEQKRISALRQ